MSSILDEIVAAKRKELEAVRVSVPLDDLKRRIECHDAPMGFARAISGAAGENRTAIISELKKASPTKGLLCPDFSIKLLAAAYSRAGASALSVLTEKNYFQGDLSYLAQAKIISGLPVLRKDFIFDSYQVYEARAAGADALLLIAASLERPLLADLLVLTHELGMDALVETHDVAEIEMVRDLPCDLIGVNNRNLKTGVVSVETSIALAAEIPPDTCKISESGIKNRTDIERLADAGYSGFLIGETLVTSGDPAAELEKLLGKR